MVKSAITMILICFISLCFMHSGAQGIMIGLTVEQLTTDSDMVVIGQVQDVESMWSENGKLIITRATIAVTEVVAGQDQTKVITVEYLGGEIGDIGLRVSDTRPLKKGEEVLLFVHLIDPRRVESGHSALSIEAGVYTITGDAQGVYLIDANGIARKSGFLVMKKKEVVESDIPLTTLKERIRGIRK